MSDSLNGLVSSAPPANGLLPSWWNNRVGTESTLPGSSLTNQSNQFDPVVYGGTSGPVVLASQVAATRAKLQATIPMVVSAVLGMTEGFHGTPHEFPSEPGAPLGRFRDEAIGTGEGAQAYGYGHYVAGRQSVGESYKPSGADWTVGGKPLSDAYNEATDQVDKALADSDRVRGNKIAEQIAAPQSALGSLAYHDSIDAAIAEHNKHGRPSAAKWLENNRDQIQQVSRGNLYHVQILPDEDQLLDWDRPLAGQSPKIRNFFEGIPGITNDSTGAEAYRFLGRGQEQKLSQTLHEVGIPGIRYLDAGSRNQPQFVTLLDGKPWTPEDAPAHAAMQRVQQTGDVNQAITELRQFSGNGQMQRAARWLSENKNNLPGFIIAPNPALTHNYVIFHPSNLRIVGKNGQMLSLEPVDHDPFAGEQQ